MVTDRAYSWDPAPHIRSSAPAANLQVTAEIAGEAQLLVKVEHLEPARAHWRQRQLEAPPPGRARLEGEVDAAAAWLGCATRAHPGAYTG